MPLLRILMIFLFGILISCEQNVPYEINQDKEAEAFLEVALKEAGTLEKWNAITELSFIKKTRMYLPDSTIEDASVQRQLFRNYPQFYAEIEYLDDSKKRKIIQINDEVKYFENGTQIIDSLSLAKAEINIRTAYYVIGLPFKLKDKGPTLVSISNEKLSNDSIVNSLQIQHQSDNGEAKNENWWVYFSQETNEMLGYLIYHDNRYSYILNDSTAVINGFHFPILRRSMALDAKKENEYLRADYVYSDIQIKTKEE